MRLKNLILWDMKFQLRYGIYLLYAFLTVLYIIILFSMPEAWKEKAAALLIFSDPAAMGLFFMGAIVLLEKSQRVPCAFAVSPIHATEYVLSKVITLCVTAVLVAVILALTVKDSHLPYVLLGTVLSCILFTLLGIIIATKITSLNQFILYTVPIEIIAFVPAILHLFHITPVIPNGYPSNVCIDMISGNPFSPIGFLFLPVFIIVLFLLARKSVLKMWSGLGGVKL